MRFFLGGFCLLVALGSWGMRETRAQEQGNTLPEAPSGGRTPVPRS